MKLICTTALYKDEENGGWGMYDVDMNLIGTCERPDPVQIITCQDVLSVDNAAGIIHCKLFIFLNHQPTLHLGCALTNL